MTEHNEKEGYSESKLRHGGSHSEGLVLCRTGTGLQMLPTQHTEHYIFNFPGYGQ
jgi:hypothetical protein